MILECDKLMEKTKHKEILPKFNHMRDFYNKTLSSNCSFIYSDITDSILWI